jgi:adenylosuccinate lyase
VAKDVSEGRSNDLLDRLAGTDAFAAVSPARLKAELEPRRYVGRAPEQVVEFLEEFLDPLVARAAELAAEAPTAEVRV